MTMTVEGLRELIAKLDRPEWAESPARKLLDTWRFYVEREAKGNSPVWRGHLRRSITSARTGTGLNLDAEVGTNLDYAPYVHFGTDPHFPTLSEIGPWARSKGIDPYVVALSISQRGTKPQPFLTDAADAAQVRLPAWLTAAAQAIEANASGGV